MWRRYVIAWCIGMMLCAISQDRHGYSQVREIIGSAVDDSPAPPPVGCTTTSTFNMVEAGPININNTGLGSGPHVFITAPNENSYYGRAYDLSPTSANDQELAYLALNVFGASSLLGVTDVSTASNPLAATSTNAFYDEYGDRAVFWGTKITAPCNVTNCLRVTGYDGLTLASSADFSGIVVGTSQGNSGIADADNYFISMPDTAGTPFRIYKFTKVPGSTGTSTNVGNNQMTSVFDDGTFLYFVDNNNTNTIRRITKSDMTLINITIAAITTMGSAIAWDPVDDFIYVYGIVGGLNSLIKVNKTTNTVASTINLTGDIAIRNGISIDIVARKLYLFTSNGASWSLRRVNLTTFVVEQTLSNTDGGNTDWIGSQDFIHKRYWFTDRGSPSHLHRITLCS